MVREWQRRLNKKRIKHQKRMMLQNDANFFFYSSVSLKKIENNERARYSAIMKGFISLWDSFE